jgi:transcriptional regulator with XRE-family HTH domain
MASADRGFEPAKVGSRLRLERERRGISLRELARRVGVSPSLVSQIELDRVNPSVSTLYALVTELGMTMSDVFGDSPQRASRVVRARSSDEGLVARPDTRRMINLASGVRWERLTPHSDPDVEFLYVVYPVGAESCPEDALVTHGGREFGYVISGTLGVRVGFDESELGPGASIAFDSSSPHRLWAIGGEPVHAIWVVIGRLADTRAEGPGPLLTD